MDIKNVKNVGWRSGPEIEKELAQSTCIDSIRKAAALRTFLRHALPTKGYKAAAEWRVVVSLTPAGEEALRLSGISSGQDVELADIHMAIFCLFYHHELLVDCAKCDLKALQRLVNTELLSGRLRWPHQFGRLLYDKFNDSYSGDRTDHLLPDEALALVDGTAQGVYQAGHLVSGPLGLIEASCARWIPPRRSLVLWHCSDPGCQSPHAVDLLPVEVPLVQVIREVRKALEAHLGPASEWLTPLADVLGGDIPREPYTYYDVVTTIAECIVREERSSLVTAAIGGSNGTLLRDVLGKPPRKKASGRGAPEALAKALGDEEQLQLLFLISDCDLIGLIDQCIKHSSICVPLGEIGRAHV